MIIQRDPNAEFVYFLTEPRNYLGSWSADGRFVSWLNLKDLYDNNLGTVWVKQKCPLFRAGRNGFNAPWLPMILKFMTYKLDLFYV